MSTEALSWRRRAAGFLGAAAGLPALTAGLLAVPRLGFADDILLFLAAVVAVALLGGLWPALVAAVGGFVLLNWYFTPPLHTLAVATADSLVALSVFVVVAVAVSSVVDLAARRTRHAVRAAVALRQQRLTAVEEADRMRTALLAAVSHDLRTPLAAAKAAVAGLRSPDVAFDEHDRGELLATAEESLDRLAGLVANLLDLSRLQAGVLGIVPADVGLEDVVPRALDELGEAGRAVTVDLPAELAAVRADPGLLDRVLVNVVGNALRYSPPGRPPALAGRAAGAMVELCVVDHGPGIPAADRERVFQPFQRLGDRDNHTGVGLGLALSRGLAEAMGGTLRPEPTPGGGLTMVLALPAAPGGSLA
jgi:two-component system sensor histidine kinase KdpD